MFLVDDLKLGRVSWYYETIYSTSPFADMGFPHFTPMDLGARWITKQANWPQDSHVFALAGGGAEFDRYLAGCGNTIISAAGRVQDYVAGAYLIAESKRVGDPLIDSALDELHRIVFPSGKLLLAIQMPFASNGGFDHVRAVAEEEKNWLAMPQNRFRSECRLLPSKLATESPAVLARAIFSKLQVSTEPSFSECTVERFVFDPDVMTTPMDRYVVDLASAQRLQGHSGEQALRSGVLLIGMSRTERI